MLLIGKSTDFGQGSKRVQTANRRVVDLYLLTPLFACVLDVIIIYHVSFVSNWEIHTTGVSLVLK